MLHVTCTCTCECVRVCEMQARYATDAPLDEFHCSNSILTVVKWLIERRGRRARVGARGRAPAQGARDTARRHARGVGAGQPAPVPRQDALPARIGLALAGPQPRPAAANKVRKVRRRLAAPVTAAPEQPAGRDETERRGRGRRRHFSARHGDWQADELTRGYVAARCLCYPAVAHGAAREARQWPPSTYRLSRGEARAEVSWHTVVCDCRVNAGAAGRTRLGLGWAWGGWGGVGDVSSNAM